MKDIDKELSTILRKVVLFDEEDKLETDLIENIKELFKESVPAETLVMPKTDRTKTIKHLYDSACGYGFADIMKHKDNSGYEKFASILNAIPEELFSEFIYTLYRIAEKSGDEGFSI